MSERRQTYVHLDFSVVERLLLPVFKTCRVQAMTLLKGGKLNTNYKVSLETRRQPVVFRIYTNDPVACERDASIDDLISGSIPRAPMLYHAVSTPDFDYAYAVFEWIDGVLLSDVLQSHGNEAVGGVARAAGIALAALNRFSFPSVGFLGPNLQYTKQYTSAADFVRTYMQHLNGQGRVEARMGSGEYGRVMRFVDDHVGCLDVADASYSLVHADFTGNNLIVEECAHIWEVRAIIDWEFAMACTALFDIGIFLRDEDDQPKEFRSHFIQGFQASGGHLVPGWRRASKLLDMTNQFAFLDAEGNFPKTFRHALSYIHKTIDEWENY